MTGSVRLEVGGPESASELVKDRPERELLRSLLEQPASGQSALVLRGDRGVGKSTLLKALAVEGPRHGLRVLRARGAQAEAELPFSGLHQLLYPLREHIGRLPGTQQEALQWAFGLAEGPQPTRFVISAAALALVDAAVSAEGPLLLLMDDVSGIDRQSAEVLGFVARRLADQPVLFVAAVSDADPDTLTAGLPELHVRPYSDVRSGIADQVWSDRERGQSWQVPEVAEADLTHQELRIAGLAAQGLTNKQIGELLFLSHRTVGTHLYKVFPKLGISSRAALRDALEAHTRRALAH